MSTPLHQRLAEYIQTCGHTVTLLPFEGGEGHHAIRFQCKGQRYQVNVYGDDPHFLHMVYGCRLPASRPPEDDLRCIALGVQDEVKAVKFGFDGDIVLSQVEQFLVDGAFEPVFWRCAEVAEAGAREFFQRLPQAAVAALAEARAASERFLASVQSQAGSAGSDNDITTSRPRKGKGAGRAPRKQSSDESAGSIAPLTREASSVPQRVRRGKGSILTAALEYLVARTIAFVADERSARFVVHANLSNDALVMDGAEADACDTSECRVLRHRG
ncbi:MAG: hypothetical protein WAN59_00460 [Candidatus Baltobacteraceae bacterium]